VPVLFAMRGLGYDPGYARSVWLLALLLAALPTAVFLVVFHRWLGRRFGSDSPAVFAAPAVVMASPWIVYGALFFGHALAASLVGLGVLVTLGPLGSGENLSGRRVLLGGLLLGLAVLTEYQCALIALGVALAVIADRTRRGRMLWLIAGGVGPAIALMVWNTASFGGPFTLAYGLKANPDFARTHAAGFYGIAWPTGEGLHGVLLSARRGLLFMAPWMALAAVGLFRSVLDRGVATAWRVVLAFGVILAPLAIAGFSDWHGGLCLGPRYLLFALPVLGVAASLAIDRIREKRWGGPVLGVFAGLTVSGFLLCLAGHLVRSHVPEQIVNPLFEIVLPVLATGGPAPTIWSAGSGITPGSILTVAAAVAVFAVAFPSGRTDPGRGFAILLAVAFSAHLFMVARPGTEGREARAMILHERSFSHWYMRQPEAEQRTREKLEKEIRALRAEDRLRGRGGR